MHPENKKINTELSLIVKKAIDHKKYLDCLFYKGKSLEELACEDDACASLVPIVLKNRKRILAHPELYQRFLNKSLEKAIEKNAVKCARAFVDGGGDPDIAVIRCGKYGRFKAPILFYCLQELNEYNYKILRTLLCAGANPNLPGKTYNLPQPSETVSPVQKLLEYYKNALKTGDMGKTRLGRSVWNILFYHGLAIPERATSQTFSDTTTLTFPETFTAFLQHAHARRVFRLAQYLYRFLSDFLPMEITMMIAEQRYGTLSKKDYELILNYPLKDYKKTRLTRA
jgi:hypothetical protein